jgi:hypothetical protein
MKTGLFAFLILAGALVVQNSARADSSDSAYFECTVKMETEQTCGTWKCSDHYFSRIEGLTMVKKVNGVESPERDILITSASYDNEEDAQKASHKILQSLVEQKICPTETLN